MSAASHCLDFASRHQVCHRRVSRWRTGADFTGSVSPSFASTRCDCTRMPPHRPDWAPARPTPGCLPIACLCAPTRCGRGTSLKSTTHHSASISSPWRYDLPVVAPHCRVVSCLTFTCPGEWLRTKNKKCRRLHCRRPPHHPWRVPARLKSKSHDRPP